MGTLKQKKHLQSNYENCKGSQQAPRLSILQCGCCRVTEAWGSPKPHPTWPADSESLSEAIVFVRMEVAMH